MESNSQQRHSNPAHVNVRRHIYEIKIDIRIRISLNVQLLKLLNSITSNNKLKTEII